MRKIRPENPSVFIPGMVVLSAVVWVIIGVLLFGERPADQAVSGAGCGFFLSLIYIFDHWRKRRRDDA
ncbi:hypothetical protein [Haladaptatus sp. CMAA 1911]|uniref:hypothetical protein n=1 Tax=unclassified Haladaptatus TaxID=2622732 RepID=UPI003754D2F6